MAEPVFKRRKPHISRAEEDDGNGEPDLETMLVLESVNRELESEKHIVQDTDCDRGRDTMIYRKQQRKQRPRENTKEMKDHNTPRTCKPSSRTCNGEVRPTT